MRDIVLIAHNLRSCHNVGSLLRTADGLGAQIYLTGYTPYPRTATDKRLPHIADKMHKQISKTALGAESNTKLWQYHENVFGVLAKLQQAGYETVAIEQSPTSQQLPSYAPAPKLALVVGREVEGIETVVLEQVDKVLEIPMFGEKESYNVVQAAAMALYHCRFFGADK